MQEMNELDLLKQFRDSVPEPSSDARLRARAALSAAEADGDDSMPARRRLLRLVSARPWGRGGRTRPERRWAAPRRLAVLGASSFGALVVAGALLAFVPWSSSPDFLARAATALTPEPGTVLYESWESTVAPADRNSPERPWATVAPDQLWIEGGSQHRYRVILEPRADSKAFPDLPGSSGIGFLYGAGSVSSSASAERLERLGKALEGHALELGGTLAAQNLQTIPQTLTFVPPDELWEARLLVSFGAPLPGAEGEIESNVVDPVSELRTAIEEGRAHEAGTTQIEGRTAERIDFEPPAGNVRSRLVDPQYVYSHTYAYVEPETLYPIEIDLNGMYYRFLSYEYLPATPANLALADIQTEHPAASIAREEGSSGEGESEGAAS
jgi:hypothetical protein